MNPSSLCARYRHGFVLTFLLSSSVDPSQLDYLISFKQYCDYLRNAHPRSHFDDDEYTKKYTAYKEKFNAKQLEGFFELQKEKEWFQEKYHPTFSADRKQEIKQLKRRYFDQYLKDLEAGKYDDVRFDEPEGGFAQQEASPSNVGNSDEWEPRLIIKTVPPTIPRNKIVEVRTDEELIESQLSYNVL